MSGEGIFMLENTDEVKGRAIRARKKMSPEHKTKIALAATIRWQNPEFRSRMSAKAKQKMGEPSTKKKHLASMEKLFQDHDYRERLAAANRKTAQTPAWLAKHKIAMQQRSANTVWQKNHLLAMRAMVQSSTWRKNHRDGCHKRSQKDTWKQNHKQGVRLWANSPKGRAQILAANKASRQVKISRAERIVHALLDLLDVKYLVGHRIGRYVADIFIPDKSLVVECDGLYWHTLPGRAEKDVRRDAYMRALGYSILRLPEQDIKKGQVESRLLEKLTV